MRRIVVTLVLLLAPPAAWADEANAVYHCAAGQFDAVGACTAVIQSGDAKDKVTAYENRGGAYARGGDLENALADETQAIALDPTAAVAYADRGMIEQEQGHADKAIADMTQALKLGLGGGAEQMQVLNARAAAYAEQGHADAAEADYRAALALAPNDTTATAGLARIQSGRTLTLGLEVGGVVAVLLAAIIAVVLLRRRRSR